VLLLRELAVELEGVIVTETGDEVGIDWRIGICLVIVWSGYEGQL
jgi:hypothetical protein